jgi:hypothetical protein
VDTILEVAFAVENFACNDYVWFVFDILESVSSSTGIILGNIPSTKTSTVSTVAITVMWRSFRLYYKNVGGFFHCVTAVGHGIKQVIQNKMNH